MDPSTSYPDSPMDVEDAVYPCKGCGEILEEGKAFELAGNRWHIDCFRCNTCGTILDSDANLLLLGDGSLICNNCTYSCSVCGNKIEDLAILTGDQAFCANCFKCRNCKKKIENLKYARTSQGIFCMECHESLMQRRRKKSQKSSSNRHKHGPQPPSSTMLLDKSLPSLPPSAVDRSVAFSPETSSPISESHPENPTDLPPPNRQRPSNSRTRSDVGTPEIPRTSQKRPPYNRSASSTSEKRNHSQSRDEDRKENLAPPHTSHNNNRHSAHSDVSGTAEDFFIPMKLDPNPAPGPSPIASRDQPESQSPQQENKQNHKDYFTNKANVLPRSRTLDQEPPSRFPAAESGAGSRNSSQPSSPHIAHQYQERGRQFSAENPNDLGRKKIHHGNSSSLSAVAKENAQDLVGEGRTRKNGDGQQNGRFKLQEVPKSRRSEKRNSKGDGQSPFVSQNAPGSRQRGPSLTANNQVEEQQVTLPPSESSDSSKSDATLSGSPKDIAPPRSHPADPHTSPVGAHLRSLPERGDSLAKTTQHPPRRVGDSMAPSKHSNPGASSEPSHDQAASSPLPAMSNSKTLPRSAEITSNGDPSSASSHLPLRAKERLALQDEDSSSDSFVAPRAPPHPPQNKGRSEISHLRNGDYAVSPKLPRYQDKDEAGWEDEQVRTPGHDSHQESGNFLRRVSNSVRHARSYSDRGVRSPKDTKWGHPKSPMIGSSPMAHDIGSPTVSSPESRREEIDRLKASLEVERQRVLELEAALDAKNSIKQMNTELKEKRSTMVVLDTQKEIVVRELETLTEHIAAAKKSGEPFDVSKMTNSVLRDFAQNLQSLKESFQPQIEDLTQRRLDLTDEVAKLDQQKERSMQEFEQLTGKNAQLADLNNQLVHQIQELYKANAGPALDATRPVANGLGIYNPQFQKDKTAGTVEVQRPSLADSSLTGTTAVQETETEPVTYVAAPQVVNIRKGQAKKFNWKKGGHNVVKVTKGIKGAFSSDDKRSQRDGQHPLEGMPYGSMSQQDYPRTDSYSKVAPQERPGFGGFFGNPKQRPQQWKNSPNNSFPMVPNDGVPPLFGSELEVRAEFERSNIPSIVMRCIQEVDARGIDIEGIYRKSGSSSQVGTIREGFERNNDYDISDPDLDINAVTSCLKQYFRKLPTPLITYNVYDMMLEAAGNQQNHDLDSGLRGHHNASQKIVSMRQAINELPPSHRDTLEVLIFHLARVIEHERDNLMTSLNTAVVFAPTIMRPESITREMQDTSAKNAAVQFLIDNCQAIFMGPPEGRDV